MPHSALARARSIAADSLPRCAACAPLRRQRKWRETSLLASAGTLRLAMSSRPSAPPSAWATSVRAERGGRHRSRPRATAHARAPPHPPARRSSRRALPCACREARWRHVPRPVRARPVPHRHPDAAPRALDRSEVPGQLVRRARAGEHAVQGRGHRRADRVGKHRRVLHVRARLVARLFRELVHGQRAVGERPCGLLLHTGPAHLVGAGGGGVRRACRDRRDGRGLGDHLPLHPARAADHVVGRLRLRARADHHPHHPVRPGDVAARRGGRRVVLHVGRPGEPEPAGQRRGMGRRARPDLLLALARHGHHVRVRLVQRQVRRPRRARRPDHRAHQLAHLLLRGLRGACARPAARAIPLSCSLSLTLVTLARRCLACSATCRTSRACRSTCCRAPASG